MASIDCKTRLFKEQGTGVFLTLGGGAGGEEASDGGGGRGKGEEGEETLRWRGSDSCSPAGCLAVVPPHVDQVVPLIPLSHRN